MIETSAFGVIFQAFHSFHKSDENLWSALKENADELAEVGFTAVWLPPAFKGAGGKDELGYGVYDPYDLGEFDQKGSIRTKYGTRSEYLDAIEKFQKVGINVIVDVVIDHLLSGDNIESIKATAYPKDDRTYAKGELFDVNVYTHFAYQARQGKYCNFEWHSQHFNATDYNADYPEDCSSILVFEGKSFDSFVSWEKGNFDYLMGCNIDFTNNDVKTEIARWGKWYLETTKANGIRIDAAKHINFHFVQDFLRDLNSNQQKPLYVVGEYWDPNVANLECYITNSKGSLDLFDIPLHYKFSEASRLGSDYNLSTILDDTLVKQRPTFAVTFVENHDTQPFGSLESVVEPWFKPIAYALILLRRDGYPCVFYPDYYGAEYDEYGSDGENYHIAIPSLKTLLVQLIYARKNHCHGEQRDYFDHSNTIGWTFGGSENNPRSMGVLLSNGTDGNKQMCTGRPDKKYIDLTGNVGNIVVSDREGTADFLCKGGSLSVWIEEPSE